MKPSFPLRNYTEALMRLIYPARCGACSGLLEIEERGGCRGCLEALKALRFAQEETCLDTDFRYLRQAWTLYPYESPFKELLAGIKFSSKRWLLQIFKPEIESWAEFVFSENNYDAIVPVPLDRMRLMERQFNQSELIADLLSRAAGCPKINALQKPHRTAAQSGLSREERLRNLHFAFETRFRAEGKTILLIDDVLTTGATAEEAARVLLENGAKQVDLFTLSCSPAREFSPPLQIS